MRILISAGEASGDAYGAAIVQELKSQGLPDHAIVEAIGGRRLRDAGASIIADSSRWGAIGPLETFKIGIRILPAFFGTKRLLSRGPAGLFIPIDYGFMNVRLARHAKAKGWRVLYFSPPGAWNRVRQGRDLPAITDAIVTPFSWSADLLNQMGARAYWFGHPIKQMMLGASQAQRGNGIAILPGSRIAEVREILKPIADAVSDLSLPIEFAVAPSIGTAQLSAAWKELCPGRKDIFTEGDIYGVLRRARAAVVCSGTATLEAALCTCPHVVVYRISKATEFYARLIRLKFKYISQPNILMDRLIVPELIQDGVQPEAIRRELESLIADGPSRDSQVEGFRELETQLGPSDAITRTAQVALELAKGA